MGVMDGVRFWLGKTLAEVGFFLAVVVAVLVVGIIYFDRGFTTIFVYETGEWCEYAHGSDTWRELTPCPMYQTPPVAEPVEVADAPEAFAAWECHECDLDKDGPYRNLPSATRCGRCGSPKP